MDPTMFAFFVLGAGLAQAAINLQGTQAVEPATTLDDPSPIADTNTYHPDQHNCPLPCIDYANTHSWIPYFSVSRLRRCQEPMLLQFSVSRPLQDPLSDVIIRSCTLQTSTSLNANEMVSVEPMKNPKKGTDLFQISLDVTPACATNGTKAEDKLEVSESGSRTGDSVEHTSRLLEGMDRFFMDGDNCDENILFAYYNETMMGLYIGAGLGKRTITSAIQSLTESLRLSNGTVPDRTVVQLCNDARLPERVFGIAIDRTRNLTYVQDTVSSWALGTCAKDLSLRSAGPLDGAKVFDIAGASWSMNSTINSSLDSRDFKGDVAGVHKRATCRYIKVESGDGCASLASRCGISGNVFTKYNPKSNLCATLQPGDYVCCSAGDPYTEPKSDAPKPGPDGVCATRLIQNGDTCASLAKTYGVTIDDLEKWNKGKTWAWTECKDMLLGYNMCISDGLAPMPPPQQGTECGPLVPGTQRPTGSGSVADLNPCPLKACCSNWGFCGVFPAHCDVHAPPGGGPGTKEKGFSNTCVSNCGNDIKQVSGPPSVFQRVGYYSAFNLNRKCLWLKAKNANTDGSYTHIHWAFGDIDPATWKPAIKDGKGEWSDFKALTGVKKILSLGGWAFSTEPATYHIIRRAILENRETFANNLVQFATDEGLDGIDIDWEYPGAPDILVGGQPIGQKTDGIEYLKFLTLLKEKIGSTKSVSIAAPASFWYLKAFPIDRIAKVIDYIVYMTYDLHGQWDYGNPNSFDMCDSGKCIRSHVNLTETRNALSIITKAGVPNNKVFVGEASYGRSFHMAQDGCWGPMCEFTGTRTQSDAAPGRCTNTGGYLGAAEIMEIIHKGVGARTFHDSQSNSDIMLYRGDYISYMTPATKDTRRSDWQGLNFAGSIDWALDLQTFGPDDMNVPPEIPEGGEGCLYGEDITLDSSNLCDFSCNFGFCPESLCTCYEKGPLEPLPPAKPDADIVAWDEFDVDLNRLCKFACKYGYCPENVCMTRPVEPEVDVEPVNNPNYYDYEAARRENANNCLIYRYPPRGFDGAMQCYNPCKAIVEQAKSEERTTNYGCVGFFPGTGPIPWQKVSGLGEVAGGKCTCDNMLLNEIADTILEALPAIAQIGCYLLMSTIKTVLDVGLDFIPGVGKVLSAGLDMATTAAQMVNYVYNSDQDPAGAFEWWLSPCGGTDLVPDDIKKAFGILGSVADGVSSFKRPKNIKKGSGKKGDAGNPKSPTKPRPGGGVSKPKSNPKCRIRPGQATRRMGAAKNTLRMQDCAKDKTVVTELVVTSLTYAAHAKPTQVTGRCDPAWTQACYHYESAISVNPQWATLTCPPEAASTQHREDGVATRTWAAQHQGEGWKDTKNRAWQKVCDRDEYPPAYLLAPNDPAMVNGGLNARGQLVRYLPDAENRPAGGMWKGVCFKPPVADLSDQELSRRVGQAPAAAKHTTNQGAGSKLFFQTLAAITVDQRPEFTIQYNHAAQLPNHGLNANPCWPSKIARRDPGFAVMTFDHYYGNPPAAPPYRYADRLFETGLFSDLRVICGGREWNLHRNILASRCDWFHKALGGSFEEARTQTITIQEFDPGDVDLLLEYIYVGAIDLEQKKGAAPLIDICVRFYDLADFFLLPQVQECAVSQFRRYNLQKCGPLQNQYWTRDIDNVDAILYDLRAAYGQKTPAGDVFRELMRAFVHESRYRFFRCRPFIELLDEIPALAVDVLTTMIRSGEFMRLTYPQTCSACGARKGDAEHHSHTIVSGISRTYTLCQGCVAEKAVGPSVEDWDGRWSAWELDKAI